MDIKRVYFVLLALMLIVSPSLCQFAGGDGDGFGYGFSLSSINEQALYCSGGDAHGFSSQSIIGPVNDQTLYCTGGDGDGFGKDGSPMVPMVDQSLYCSGGYSDGYDFSSAITSINIQYIYCSGGNFDGYEMASYSSTINSQYIYCQGGVGDGYDNELYDGSVFGLSIFTYGGDGDGYTMNNYAGSVFGSSIFCNGGNGDGYSLGVGASLPLGVGIWTGLSNTEWNTNTNWIHDITPGIQHNVTIPAGCPNYPVLTNTLGIDTIQGVFECRGLDIHQHASVITNAPLYNNGEVNIAGNYTATMNSSNANRIYNGASLTIAPTGFMILGNQTTLWGMTDLEVYDGSLLNIDGGTLHIDDQLHVYSGGTLLMTGGELFVHKFGNGNSYFASNPANFYVEAGAVGGISGGTLKICGRTTTGGYHSFTILEPEFDISGTATVQFEHGVYGIHFDNGMYTADGVTIQNLILDKPGNTVFINSNATILGDVTIEAGSTLEIESGNTINVGP